MGWRRRACGLSAPYGADPSGLEFSAVGELQLRSLRCCDLSDLRCLYPCPEDRQADLLAQLVVPHLIMFNFTPAALYKAAGG